MHHPAPGAQGQTLWFGLPLARGWKCHAEAAQASSGCKQGLPGDTAGAGTAGMAFQAALFALSRGSSLEPPQPISRALTSCPWLRCPISHCEGKARVPRFPVTWPHLLRGCISSRGDISGHPPTAAEIPRKLLGGALLHTRISQRDTPPSALQPGVKQHLGSIQLCTGSVGWQGAPEQALLGQMSHCTQPLPLNTMPHCAKPCREGTDSASHRAQAHPVLLAASRTYTLSPQQGAPLKPVKFKPDVQHPPHRAEYSAAGIWPLPNLHNSGFACPGLPMSLWVGTIMTNLPRRGNDPVEERWRHRWVHRQLQDVAMGWICTVQGVQPTPIRDTTSAR